MLKTTEPTHNPLQNAILKVLHYFAFFKHPLKSEELIQYLQIDMSCSEFDTALHELIDAKKVFQLDSYYSSINEPQFVAKRRKGEAEAERLLPMAMRCGRLIARFPFVRFVGISGSLSKGYADEKTDFDFFIITAKNRLWIARTFLHLFKKFTFLFNKEKYFCMNYFIDETQLEIEDQNIFVQFELATLLPVYNTNYYSLLTKHNRWVNHNMPKFTFNKTAPFNSENIFKKLIEICMWLLPLNGLNKKLMQWTDSKWKRKWKLANYPMEDYELAFRTRINVSKNHPMNYQKLILSKLSEFQ
jgi:hypothetical protein